MNIEERNEIVAELEAEKETNDREMMELLGFDTVAEMETELEVEQLISRAAALGVTLLRVHNGGQR